VEWVFQSVAIDNHQYIQIDIQGLVKVSLRPCIYD